jgi:hypothetical protein
LLRPIYEYWRRLEEFCLTARGDRIEAVGPRVVNYAASSEEDWRLVSPPAPWVQRPAPPPVPTPGEELSTDSLRDLLREGDDGSAGADGQRAALRVRFNAEGGIQEN